MHFVKLEEVLLYFLMFKVFKKKQNKNLDVCMGSKYQTSKNLEQYNVMNYTI